MFSLKDFGVTKEVGLLENGTRVVLFKRSGAPISTAVVFNSGSRFDPVGKEGLAHFSEHMLFQKNKRFKSQAEIAKYLEEIGGDLNAWTDSEEILYYTSISDKADYGKVVVVVDNVFNGLEIDSKMFENERNVILKEISDSKADPGRYVYDLTDKLMFQDTELGRNTLGSVETVSSVKESDIMGFYRKMLNPSRMTIVVSGDIDLKELVDAFNKGMSFPVLEREPHPEFQPLVVNRKKNTLIENYNDTDNNQIVMGFRTCSMFNEDKTPLEILATICGSGFTSSLFKKLRDENGLVYGVSVISNTISDSGVWVVVTSTPKKTLQKLFDLVCEEFVRIHNGGITDAELHLAKDKYLKSKKQRMQTSYSWVTYHATEELLNPTKALSLDQHMNKINKVTLEDIRRVGKKYFGKGLWYLAMCGDATEKDFKINY